MCKVWGTPTRNAAAQTVCHRCHIAKGKCKAKNIQPEGAPTESKNEVQQAHQAKNANSALEELRKEMRELKAFYERNSKKAAAEEAQSAVPEAVTELNLKIKHIDKRTQALEDMPEVLRGHFYPNTGDFDAELKKLAKQRNALLGEKMGEIRPGLR